MCDLIPNYSYAYGNLPKTAQKLHLDSEDAPRGAEAVHTPRACPRGC